ncbi:hypothetical protein [Pelagibius sp.]|uniref:hypothetical protein n=1 Tax=Pelagibius sp. TaxID=1931238 RepID=UPI003BAFDDF7
MPHGPLVTGGGETVWSFRQFAYLLRLKKQMAETIRDLESSISGDSADGPDTMTVDVARAREIIARFEAIIREIEDPTTRFREEDG